MRGRRTAPGGAAGGRNLDRISEIRLLRLDLEWTIPAGVPTNATARFSVPPRS